MKALMVKSATVGDYGSVALHQLFFSKLHPDAALTFPWSIFKNIESQSLLSVTDTVPANHWQGNWTSSFWLFAGLMFVVIFWMRKKSIISGQCCLNRLCKKIYLPALAIKPPTGSRLERPKVVANLDHQEKLVFPLKIYGCILLIRILEVY